MGLGLGLGLGLRSEIWFVSPEGKSPGEQSLIDLEEFESAIATHSAQLIEELQARECEAAEAAKAHSAAEARRAAEIAELNAQLDSGKPP